MRYAATIAKALVGTAAAGVGSLAVAASDGTITTGEYLTATAAALVALAAVWRTPNADEEDEGATAD